MNDLLENQQPHQQNEQTFENEEKDIDEEEIIDDDVQLYQIPDEILEFILTYLPPYEDLKNCSLVCKRWHEIVKNLIRRSKINLHNGLLDYRLRWEMFTQRTANTIVSDHIGKNANTLNSSTSLSSSSSSSSSVSTTLPMIAGRFSHSTVRHNNSMYVFGGGSSSDTTFNDLWRFDLSDMCWERPLSKGHYPSPKGSASMVCWHDQLILFGGWRYPSLHPPYQPWCLFDELHYYDLASNRWTVHNIVPSPPPMAGHSATVHGDCMVVFGGYQIAEDVNSNSNETWCLDLRDNKWWQPRFVGNTKPQPRYGQFQLELDDKHLLIVGGCGGPNSVYSDCWLLDMTRDIWIWRSIPVRNKKFAASHMWCNPACKIDDKLVVLGPTPNMPQDFQLMRQSRVPIVGGMAAPRNLAQNNRNNMDRQRLVGAGALQQPGGGLLGNQAPGLRLINVPNRNDNYRIGDNQQREHGPGEHYHAQRRAIINQSLQNANNNFLNNPHLHNNNNNNNNNLQPSSGRLSDLHNNSNGASTSTNNAALAQEEKNQNRPLFTPPSPSTSSSSSSSSASSSSSSTSSQATRQQNGVARNDNDVGHTSNGTNNTNDIEAANRLQRNLALRCRDNEPLLPKRFDELYEDPFRMAAFNVQNRPRYLTKDHSERIRRLEEKMNAIRNSRRNAMLEQKIIKEPSPKRVKRNVLSLFVCDLSNVLDNAEPYIEWIEYKNFGIIPGAPERLILSTMIAGNGELILFGGVHKETLSEISHQVSNTVHFLSAQRDIV